MLCVADPRRCGTAARPHTRAVSWSILRLHEIAEAARAGDLLLLGGHPLPVAAMSAVALTLAAALSGRSGAECALVAATVLIGQLTVGWINDVVDADRDRQTGRQDKPIAMGWVSPGARRLRHHLRGPRLHPAVPANGTASPASRTWRRARRLDGNFYFKSTVCSWLPYGGELRPAARLPVLRRAGTAALHGGPPTIAMTVLAAMLGIGIHFLNTLPDLVEDDRPACGTCRCGSRCGSARRGCCGSRSPSHAGRRGLRRHRADRRPAPVTAKLAGRERPSRSRYRRPPPRGPRVHGVQQRLPRADRPALHPCGR